MQEFLHCGCEDNNAAVTAGLCKIECGNNFYIYIAASMAGGFIIASVVTPNILVRMRSVEDRDKPFALGVTKTLLSIFGSIPYPMIFGYVSTGLTDSGLI